MKKIVIFAVTIIAAVVFMQLFQFKPMGIIDSDGFVISNESIRKNLTDKNLNTSKVIEPVEIKSSEKIYKRFGKFYLGSKKDLIDLSYPLYVNDSAALMCISDKSDLITEQFEKVKSYNGLYVSNGHTYNADKELADGQEFILVHLSNDLYINAAKTTVSTTLGNTEIRMNSVINFEKDRINYYTLVNGMFVPETVMALNEFSTINIGGHSYNYYSLLEKLGKIEEEKQNNSSVVSDTNDVTTTPESTVTTTMTSETNSNKQITTTTVHSSKKQDNQEVDTLPADTEVQAPITGAPAKPNPNPPPAVIEPERPQQEYVEPVVKFNGITPDVYFSNLSMQIEDGQNRIDRGVKVEVLKDGNTYLRKSLLSSGDYKLQILEPGTEYKVIVSYTYKNKFGIKKDVKVCSETFKTLPISNLNKAEFSFENGEIFSDKISVNNIKNKNPEKESNAVPYIDKVKIEFNNGMSSNLSGSQINSLKKGNAVNFVSQPLFKSNSKYCYEIKMYDKFGNVMPLLNELNGKTNTCKKPPEANVIISENEINKTKLNIQITNPDGADLKSCGFEILDKNNNEISTSASINDSSFKNDVIHSLNCTGNNSVTISGLSSNSAYSIIVYGDFDVGDGKYLNGEKKQIYKTVFATKPLSSLGNFYINDDLVDITDDGCKMKLSVDKEKTNELLLFLTSYMNIEISNSNVKENFSKELTPDELQKLKNGETITLDISNLKSCTEYNIHFTVMATQGSDTSVMRIVSGNSKLKTLRKTPQVVIKNAYVTSSSIDLTGLEIVDPDNAIGENVVMKITDEKGTVVSLKSYKPNEVYHI